MSIASVPNPVLDYSSDGGNPAPGSRNPLLLVPGLILLAIIGLAGKWIEASIKAYGTSHHRRCRTSNTCFGRSSSA